MSDEPTPFDPRGFSCPTPQTPGDAIAIAHGGGGSVSRELIQRRILPVFDNPLLAPLHDGAVFPLPAGRVAFTTDAFVMEPLFVPGADIGSVAVNGTVNDLCMCGATPLYLSAAFVIEEGFALDLFDRVLASMRAAADRAGVSIVTGDTKVVERGKADRLYIATSGIGLVPDGIEIDPRRITPGDAILLSGPIAQHGIAVLSRREGFAFETEIRSDCAALTTLVRRMLDACPDIRVLRDPTRGGVASVLVEIAEAGACGLRIDERSIPITAPVRAACDLLGFDPLHVANEGRCIAVVPAGAADAILNAMRADPNGKEAARIGTVVPEHPGTVTMRTRIGGLRDVRMLSGEQLPRIC
jgi:hydrogenase expression/formation protein HypE